MAITEYDNSPIHQMLEVFLNKYEPAPDVRSTTDFLSSDEILIIFESMHFVSKNELFEELKKAGFKFELVDCRFLWLLKEKEA